MTTPDYAGLIPQNVMDAARKEWMRVAEERGNWDAALAAALRVSHRTLLENNAELERERDMLATDFRNACEYAAAAEAERDRLKERVAELKAAIDRVLKPAPGVRKPEPWIYGGLGTARSPVKGGVDGE